MLAANLIDILRQTGTACCVDEPQSVVYSGDATDDEGVALFIDPRVLQCFGGDFGADACGVAHSDGDQWFIGHGMFAPLWNWALIQAAGGRSLGSFHYTSAGEGRVGGSEVSV